MVNSQTSDLQALDIFNHSHLLEICSSLSCKATPLSCLFLTDLPLFLSPFDGFYSPLWPLNVEVLHYLGMELVSSIYAHSLRNVIQTSDLQIYASSPDYLS